MSRLSQIVSTIRKTAAFMLLPLLASSCHWMNEDYDCEETADSSAAQYINITISVSTGNFTRSNPTGGEYGDGPEKGIEDRENKVNDITLIFYQDEAGINTSNGNAKVVCVKKYTVYPYEEPYYPIGHDHPEDEPYNVQTNEVLYTTGEQKLEETTLVAGETYKLLVVANAPDDLGIAANQVIASSDVRDKVLASVYEGSGVGINARNFVMASAAEATINLRNPRVYTSPTEAEKNRFVYYLDCIHIERLAARIDFWAKESNGYKSSTDNAAYTTPGYEYTISRPDGTATNDRFVLTSITPFNLNNGNEYLFKRTNDNANPYLANETFANWVTDPYTSGKNLNEHPAYFASTLTSVIANHNNFYNVTMASQQSNKFDVTNDGYTADNIIVGYAKENTLRPQGDSPLFYYATGLAFEGYYYRGGTGTGERCVFYHFIRHQGDSNDAYQTYTNDNISMEATKAVKCPTLPSMNFGIVRNNVYRISVDKVSAKGGFIELSIREMRWRHIDNPVIYL